MRTSRHPLFAIVLLLASAACAPADRQGEPSAASPPLSSYDWLLGTFHGVGEGMEFREAYRLQDDSTIVIEYFTDGTMTARQPVTGTVEQRGGELIHTYGEMRWRAHERSEFELAFEPVENATNRFRWIRVSGDEWRAESVDRDEEGREVRHTFVMRRLGE